MPYTVYAFKMLLTRNVEALCFSYFFLLTSIEHVNNVLNIEIEIFFICWLKWPLIKDFRLNMIVKCNLIFALDDH